MKCGFSKHFSMVRSPNLVLTPLKSASRIRISSFVPPSKIFVWDHKLGKKLYEDLTILTHMLVRKLTYPIRRGYFSQMLFPTWLNKRSVRVGVGRASQNADVSNSHGHAVINTTHYPKERACKMEASYNMKPCMQAVQHADDAG